MKERLMQILHYIEDNGSASTVELTSIFGVSEMTIRRDLIALEKDKKIIRFHGGASIRKNVDLEAAFEIRMSTNHHLKVQIGNTAVEYIADLISSHQPNSIFLGSGSTMYCMAQQLKPIPNISIITDNVYVSSVLAAYPENTVIAVGGQIILPSMNAIGYVTEKMISEFSIDYAFFSSSAIDEQGNLYTYNLLEASVFSTVIAASKHIVLLADHTKLGRKNLVQIASLSKSYTLITDNAAPETCLNHYAQLGTQIIIASPPGKKS